jgi:transposase InsO family protein
MRYYNERRRHGSLRDKPPREYHKAIMRNDLKPEVIAA